MQAYGRTKIKGGAYGIDLSKARGRARRENKPRYITIEVLDLPVLTPIWPNKSVLDLTTPEFSKPKSLDI